MYGGAQKNSLKFNITKGLTLEKLAVLVDLQGRILLGWSSATFTLYFDYLYNIDAVLVSVDNNELKLSIFNNKIIYLLLFQALTTSL